jgi:hypothetical protein
MKDGYITNTQFGLGGGEETLPTHQAAAAASSSSGPGLAGFLTSVRGMMGGGGGAAASSSSSATSTQTQGAPTTGNTNTSSSAGFVVRGSPCALCLDGHLVLVRGLTEVATGRLQPFSGQGHTLRAG